MQVSPSLIKRQKTHFHNLPCGASIILANNGFVWLYPTPEQQEEEAGGFYTSLEVKKEITLAVFHCFSNICILYIIKHPLGDSCLLVFLCY